jgi:hypothetical protein
VGGAGLAGLRALKATGRKLQGEGYKNIKALPIFAFLLHSSYQLIKPPQAELSLTLKFFSNP